MAKGTRIVALALIAITLACGTTTPVVWRGGGITMKADEGVQERFTPEVAAIAISELQTAVAWWVERFPEHGPRLIAEAFGEDEKERRKSGGFTMYCYTPRVALGGYAAGVYMENQQAAGIWLEGEPVNRLGRLLAHEFGHAAAYIVWGHTDSSHVKMYEIGYRW